MAEILLMIPSIFFLEFVFNSRTCSNTLNGMTILSGSLIFDFIWPFKILRLLDLPPECCVENSEICITLFLNIGGSLSDAAPCLASYKTPESKECPS